MGRGDQLARQWRIIQTLISSKQGKSVADLVKDENCHPRTIYRDLEALKEAGLPCTRVADYIKEKIWHHTQRIEPQKDGSIIFSAEVAGTDEIKAWVMSWGRHAEILEPEFLRREVVQELSDCVKAYTRLSRRAEPA